MANLVDMVKTEVEWYAADGYGFQLRLLKVFDEVHQTYGIIGLDEPNPQQHPSSVVVMARVVGNIVIIEEDRTDRPLVDMLIQAGIPREQIVLAYEGEPLPE